MRGRLRRISKRLSYILRHNPGKFGITLEPDGWVPLSELSRKAGISADEILEVVKHQDKRRFEVKGGKIRALYGHSVMALRYDPVEPPEILYHGTSPESARKILREGLRPMGRAYVHLSVSPQEAFHVGRRHSENPVILRIKASEAFRDGIEFYRAGDLYLTAFLPPTYIEKMREASGS